MPISLPPISRRRFLAGSVAAGLGLMFREPLFGGEVAADPHRFALLSDSHINADPKTISRGANMTDNFKQACSEVLKLETRPAAVLLDGDCAHNSGEAGDYAALVGLLQPLREGGLPVHMALGNHDNRDRFWQAFPPAETVKRPVQDCQAMIVPAEWANWFILDSLDKTNSTPGACGAKQLAWLGQALDAHAEKPALVMVHHHPEVKTKTPPGLTDTEAFLNVLRPRKQVKVVFYGHTHTWDVQQYDGVHFINFPPVAYVFTAGYPSGWVDAQLKPDGMTLELRSIDPKHPKHGEKHELTWRA